MRRLHPCVWPVVLLTLACTEPTDRRPIEASTPDGLVRSGARDTSDSQPGDVDPSPDADTVDTSSGEADTSDVSTDGVDVTDGATQD